LTTIIDSANSAYFANNIDRDGPSTRANAARLGRVVGEPGPSATGPTSMLGMNAPKY